MRLPLLLILCFSLLFVTNCKPDKKDCFDPSNPQCKNYDPCYGQKPVKAEIELTQRYSPFGTGEITTKYSPEGDVFPNTQIRFHCPLEGAKYTWTLGAETITSRTFERMFDLFTVPFGEYSVRLVVEKTPNKNCFPYDDGIDTFVKKFRIVPVCSLATMGLFKGKWDNLPKNDSSLISMRVFTSMNYLDSCGTSLFRFTNLTGNQDTLLGDYIYLSNTELISDFEGSQGLGTGNFKINLKDSTVLMDYYVGQTHYLFRGRRLSK